MTNQTKYTIKMTSKFKKEFKKSLKQGRNKNKFIEVLEVIANDKKLDKKYKNHKLLNNKIYNNCYECHIEPDWLLIYQIHESELILVLVQIGSHSDLFR